MTPELELELALDPGHGLDVRGFYPGISEYRAEGKNNFKLYAEIRRLLLPYKVKIVSTRTLITDNPWPRGAMFPTADAYISLHSNSFKDSSVRGTECFVTKGDTKSTALAKELTGAVSKFFGHNDRGVKTTSYQVVREAKAAGVPIAMLLECGFHSNKEDADILINKRAELAEVIAGVLIKHFDLKLREVERVQPVMAPVGKLYRVATGSYASRDNAVAEVKRLADKGISGFMVLIDDPRGEE